MNELMKNTVALVILVVAGGICCGAEQTDGTTAAVGRDDPFAGSFGGETSEIQSSIPISGQPVISKPPLFVRTVTLKFLSAANLKTALDKMSSEHGTVGVDENTNSLIVCDFLPFGLDRLAPFMAAATGWDFQPQELLLAGERMQTLSRVYALRTGRLHADDTLPARFFIQESFAGLMQGKSIPRDFFEGQVQEIFRLRGWDAEGRPTPETQKRLGLV